MSAEPAPERSRPEADALPERARGLTPADVLLFTQIYAELKPRAHRLLAAHRGETLNTTGLVHEAFLKLRAQAAGINDQRHLYRLCVLVMRQILLDRGRAKAAERHGGGQMQITLTGLDVADPLQPYDVALFDGVLEQLRRVDARKAEVLELHVLAGLELREIAPLIGVAEITARRDLRAASTLVEHWLRAG